MPQKSAGILLFRRTATFEFLVHPDVPFWTKRWTGAWQIAKGLVGDGETDEQAARREFEEETGIRIDGPLVALGSIRQKGGKEVVVFAAEGDCDPEALRSNSFEIEWPPRSGRRRRFPEVDAMRWFDVVQSRALILSAHHRDDLCADPFGPPSPRARPAVRCNEGSALLWGLGDGVPRGRQGPA